MRGLIIQAAILALVLITHELLRTSYARLHMLTVPLLVVPVAYYSSVLGARGAALAALVSALVIVDHINDRHPFLLAIEVGQIAGISLLGAAVAAVANRDRTLEQSEALQSQKRLDDLAADPGYWDRVSETRVGLYVTRIESQFISQALVRRPAGISADIGAGSGRLHAAILPASTAIVATEVSRDALVAMNPNPAVVRILVDPAQPTLPFRSASLRSVIAMEVPAASDEAWFRAECHRVLEPGGAAIVSVHNALSYKGLVSRLLRRLRARRGLSWAGLYYRQGLTAHVHAWRSAGFRVRSSTGFYWLPFSRASNSTWISAAAALERLFGLRWLIGWSPWVLLELERDDA